MFGSWKNAYLRLEKCTLACAHVHSSDLGSMRWCWTEDPTSSAPRLNFSTHQYVDPTLLMSRLDGRVQMEWQLSDSIQSCRTFVDVWQTGEQERRHGGFGVLASKQCTCTHPMSTMIRRDCTTMHLRRCVVSHSDCCTRNVLSVTLQPRSSPMSSPCPRHHNSSVSSRGFLSPPCIVAEPGVPRRCCCTLQ